MELPARKKVSSKVKVKKNVSASAVPKKYQKGISSAQSVARALDFCDGEIDFSNPRDGDMVEPLHCLRPPGRQIENVIRSVSTTHELIEGIPQPGVYSQPSTSRQPSNKPVKGHKVLRSTLSINNDREDPINRPRPSFYRNKHSSTEGEQVIATQGYSGSYSSMQNDSDCWGPGDVIPTSRQRNVFPDQSEQDSNESFLDMMKVFQADVTKHLVDMKSALDSMGVRMSHLETKQKELEDDMKSSETRSDISSGTSNSSGSRRRLTPIAMQNRIRQLHNSFCEESQLKPEEPINSPHNSKVVQNIIQSIGTESYPEDLIRKGCVTYRKSLAARQAVTTPVKKKKSLRSRKQRSYERRGRELRNAKEISLWNSVTPDMMSDEESDQDVYVRHPPSYRSDFLTKFIEKLELRSEKRAKTKSRPRIKRSIGQKVEKEIPHGCPNWIILKELRHSDVTKVDDDVEPSEVESNDEGSDLDDMLTESNAFLQYATPN